MAVLANGYSVTIKQKTGSTVTNIYPYTRSKNVFTTAGNDLQTLLSTVEAADGSFKTATTSQAGIVQLSNSLTSESETQAATAKAAKDLKDAIDAVEQAASDAYVLKTQLGVATSTDPDSGVTTVGVATLGTDGRVPAAQLPTFVDDIVNVNMASDKKSATYATDAKDGTSWHAGDPVVPAADIIYVDVTSNLPYRWNGLSDTALAYVEVSSSLALGTTSSTAFAGDRGLAVEQFMLGTAAGTNANATIVYQALGENDPDDHTYTNNGKIYVKVGTTGTPTLIDVYKRPWLNENSTADNPDGITKSTIGLGNVDNMSRNAIIQSITLSEMETQIGMASSSTNGLMSSTYADKLDNCMPIAIQANEPTAFTNGIWVKIEEDETVQP